MGKSTIRENAEKDPTYRPYCMRCPGLVRMSIVERFHWRCRCGAIHDERIRIKIPDGSMMHYSACVEYPSGKVAFLNGIDPNVLHEQVWNSDPRIKVQIIATPIDKSLIIDRLKELGYEIV